jgi:flagellar basal-body rod protein FlgB
LIGLDLSNLAARQADWLSTRQKLISENVSHADTPGYQARDVKPFVDLVESGAQRLTVTSPRHIAIDPASPSSVGTAAARPWDVKHSGNSVSLDQQMMKASEVRSAYNLNIGIVRAFNRMLLASVKG